MSHAIFHSIFAKKLFIYNKFHARYTLNARIHRIFEAGECSFCIQTEVRKEAYTHLKDPFFRFLFIFFPNPLFFRLLIYFYRCIIDIFRFLSISIEFYRLLSDFIAPYSVFSIIIHLLIFYNYSHLSKHSKQQSKIQLFVFTFTSLLIPHKFPLHFFAFLCIFFNFSFIFLISTHPLIFSAFELEQFGLKSFGLELFGLNSFELKIFELKSSELKSSGLRPFELNSFELQPSELRPFEPKRHLNCRHLS